MSSLLTPLSQALTYISTLLTSTFTTQPTAEQLQQQQKQHTKTQQQQARFKSWNALPLGHRWALESQQRAAGRPSFWPEGEVDSDIYKRESGDAEIPRLGWVRWVENERRKSKYPVRVMEDVEAERERWEEGVRERERRAQEREREDRRRGEVEVEEADLERREVRRLRGVLERERRMLDAEKRPG